MGIYLDNAATTPISSEVRAAMLPFLDERFGNPSSRHPLGVSAAEAVDSAREGIARALGRGTETVIFTAGGTEANNLGVLGLARAQRRKGRHVILGATEHPSVRDPALALREEGFEVQETRISRGEGLDLEHLSGCLRADTILVAQMFVNNEFGSVYPIREVARRVRSGAPQAFLHVDAVQAVGKLPLSFTETGAHSLAISAHKIHGPKGSGALILEQGVRPRPLFFGGAQEGGLRSGTENVAGIVGLARAVTDAITQQPAAAARMTALRELLGSQVSARVPGARLLEAEGGAGVSPAVAALSLPGPPAEVWMHHLEAAGVMTSVGSACQAQKKEISPALLALGLDEAGARQVLRVSFCGDSTEQEVHEAVEHLAAIERELSLAGR